MRILTIDAETQDKYIGLGLGSGWVYGLNVPDSDFKVLGFAMRTHEGEISYETDMYKVAKVVEEHDCLIMHNASYDLGCLSVAGVCTDQHTILDTEIMSRLHNSSLISHSLDNLTKRYLKTVYKLDSVLIAAVVDHNLYQGRLKNPKDKDLLKYSKSNMGQIQEVAFDAMREYAIGDIEGTYLLYKYFLDNMVDLELSIKYSDLAKVCNGYRSRGVRIDLDKANEVHNQLIPIIAKKFTAVYDIAGEEFNINSSKDMPRVFDKLGIDYPKSPKTGNASITTPWMERQDHPICTAIVEARKVLKIDRDFIQKIIGMQEYTGYRTGQYGRVYPELHLLRARTGRFSCSCPNVQQIPARDKDLSDLCRSIFVPEEGQRWFSLDYSNQEGRLQVHYAALIGAEGADQLVDEYNQDPELDMHKRVASMVFGDTDDEAEMKIRRTRAKGINLGISYGMGLASLARQLDVSIEQAKYLRTQYNTLAPFLEQLNNRCKSMMSIRGYIKTLGGRHSHIDPPTFEDGEKKTYEYKALNKLIQGSAADQTIDCMLWAYRENLPVLFPVHDSLEMSGTVEHAERLKYIMENATKLLIPVVASGNMKGGNTWAEAK